MAALMRMNAAFDIRSALSSISTPTLVLHRNGDLLYSVEHGRYLGEHIPDARFVELPGADHLPFWEDPDGILDLVEEFVTGSRRAPDPERVLATTLFTDIVSSTAYASSVGDRRWRETLDDYDSSVAKQIAHFGGRLVKTTGDGSLATFDGPTRAARCACAIRDAARQLGLEVRAGMTVWGRHRGDGLPTSTGTDRAASREGTRLVPPRQRITRAASLAGDLRSSC